MRQGETIMVMLTSATTVLADRWDGGPGPWWPIFPLLWLLLFAAVATTIVVLARRGRREGGLRAGESRLSERFAAGEIDEQEYRARLAVLRDQGR
jgi:putative membrane protein